MMLGSISLTSNSNPDRLQAAVSGFETRSGRLCLHSKQKPFEKGSLLVCVEGIITGSHSTNEGLVAELYSKHGESFVEKLDGLFFVFIWDKAEDKFLLCNNPYQTTTLYYHQSGDRLLFSKQLTDIVRNLPAKAEVDFGSVKTYLANGFNMSDRTAVKGIRRLLPTFRIRVKKNQVVLENHWKNEISFDRKPFPDLNSHLDEYEQVYRRGIRDYLERRKPGELGCLMSGGHDTTFAFLEGSQVFGKPLHAFTATFPEWDFNEETYSRDICEKFGGRFHPVPFGPNDLDYMVSMIRTLEEPMASSALPIHLVMKEASNHVDLMMGGDGGDTLWGEYYPVAEYHRYVKDLPLGVRKLFHGISRAMLKVCDWERFWELEHVASLFAREEIYSGFLLRLLTYRHFRDDHISRLLDPEVYRQNPYARSVLEVPFGRETMSEDLIASKLFNGFYPYMSFYTTKSSEHWGMDLYLPTIHRETIRFITSLPMEWVNGGTFFHRITNNKRINRRFHKAVLARYVKRGEIRNSSFDVPWYRILLPRPKMLELLLARLIRRGWYNEKELRKLFHEFRSQPVKSDELLELKNHGYRIFTLLSLEIWCIEYLDGRMTETPDERTNLEEYLA